MLVTQIFGFTAELMVLNKTEFLTHVGHIKRTNPLYLTTGRTPKAWRTTLTSAVLGSERFGVSIFFPNGITAVTLLDATSNVTRSERV